MKHLKLYENFSEKEFDAWEDAQGLLDVYKMYELLVFKYGEIFSDTKHEIDEEDGDYNPDQIYEVIEYELRKNNLWEDFLTNYEEYQNEKEEADPYHWKNRAKAVNDLMKGLDDKYGGI